jgi:hypothetical protein
MTQPAPVDISALTGLLANAKKVMDASQQKNPIVSKHTTTVDESYDKGYSSPTYDARDEREPTYEQAAPKPIAPLQNFSAEHIMASKLPQNVKEAMINRPIEKVSNFAAVNNLSEAEILKINPNAKIAGRTPAPAQIPLQENRSQNSNSDMITISRSELKEIMNETLVNFLKSNYEKTLTEKAITNTINLLIKEGKIVTKKKV